MPNNFGDYDSGSENTDFTPGERISSSEVDANYDKIEAYLNTDFVDDNSIADGAIGGAKLTGGTVTVDKLDPGIVTPIAGVPADNSVTSAKILDGSIVDADISGTADIDGDKLLDGSVNTPQLADDAVTGPKLGPGLQGGVLLDVIRLTPDDVSPLDITTVSGYHVDGKICVEVIGAGGAGGGAETTIAGEESMGSFGGSGSYAKRIISISAITDPSAIPFVVGVGGTGNAGGAGAGNGNVGGDTSLAVGETYQVFAAGGENGNGMDAGTTFDSRPGGEGGGQLASSNPYNPAAPPAPDWGDLVIPGNAGENGTRIGDTIVPQGTSGESFYGSSVRAPGPNAAGIDGEGYGTGGSPGRNRDAGGSTDKAGGAGSDGLIIIEVYA